MDSVSTQSGLHRMPRTLLAAALVLISGAVSFAQETARMTEAVFGQMPDATPVRGFTLRNANGMQVTVISYGAIITEIMAPDRNGNRLNVVAGTDDFEAYLGRFPAAAVIGRVVNRIGNARFSLDGQEFELTVNDRAKHHLHGGRRSFARVVWDAEPLPVSEDAAGVRFTYLSVDGEDGYPGNLTATVTYSLSDQNELRVDYTARTDAPTIVNMSNHAYFNLAGTRDMATHELWLNASRYTPIDSELIPTGEIASVTNTPLDFTTPEFIGARVAEIEGPAPNAYDYNFVINSSDVDLVVAARVRELTSGRVMEVLTDRPGIQLYTGHAVGFCLETQTFPDAVNHPNFPSPVIRPGAPLDTTTIFRFSVE